MVAKSSPKRLIGGSSGIGLSIVQILVSKGATVVNLDRSPPSDDQPQDVEWVKTDVTDWESQLGAFKRTIAKHGHVDTVFANAGIAEGEMALAEKIDPATGDPLEPSWSTVRVNLIGLLITVKLALHYMKKDQKGGCIILTTSRAGKLFLGTIRLDQSTELHRLYARCNAGLRRDKTWSMFPLLE